MLRFLNAPARAQLLEEINMIDRIEISACTSMMVGKKASLDGATYISRNEDRLVAIYPKRFVVQPAVTGRKETYVSPYNNLTVPLPRIRVSLHIHARC